MLLRKSMQVHYTSNKTKQAMYLTSCNVVCYSIADCNNYPSHDVQELSTTVLRWSITSDIKKSISLNKWQNQAIELALESPFHLVQGPPGKLYDNG